MYRINRKIENVGHTRQVRWTIEDGEAYIQFARWMDGEGWIGVGSIKIAAERSWTMAANWIEDGGSQICDGSGDCCIF